MTSAPRRARKRRITEAQMLQLVRLASGLLTRTNGDIVAAMSEALVLHDRLLRTVREDGVRGDLGVGTAILYVPDEGGLAIRAERRRIQLVESTEESAPTEEAEYPEIDLLGFEVIESAGEHQSSPSLDAGVDEETWFD